MPWQRWFLWHALELHPTEVDEYGEPVFRFRKVVLLVGRQNGKSTVMQALTLWRLFVDRCGLVIGTAQDLEVAESLWGESLDMAMEIDELKSEIADGGKVERQPGRKMFRLRSGETYKVKAATRRGGRGLSGELVLLDELREHQSWDAWAAVTKTTNAKARAQIYAISNAGDAQSVVLRYLRQKAHLELGDPDGINEKTDADELIEADLAEELAEEEEIESGLAIFEWSAPADADPKDRDAWAMANPSLGYRVRESTLASDQLTDPEWIFRTEVLCQWSEGTLEGPFPPGSWEGSADDESRRADGAEVALCVDVSWDRARAHIGLASWREDGHLHVEVIASRVGTDWVVPWLTDPERSSVVREAPVAIQARGAPASSLIPDLEAAGVEVAEWGGSDLGGSCGSFYDRVRAAIGEGSAETGLRHRNQPVLNVAAANASTKPLQDAWCWDRRKSPVDISPLVAVTGAAWCLTNGMPDEPAVSAYATRGVLTV